MLLCSWRVHLFCCSVLSSQLAYPRISSWISFANKATSLAILVAVIRRRRYLLRVSSYPAVFYHDNGAVLAGPRHGGQVTVPELRQPRAGLAQPRVRLPSRRVPTRDGAGHGAGEQVVRLTAGRAPGANEFKSKKTNNSTNRPNPA
jgi:hypothetical protein